MARKKLFLIDSFGFIFRAYHARARSAAPPMRTSTGLSTEAVYIFNNMLRKLGKAYSPEYIAAVFESGAPTHRMAEFAEYKANRTEAPPDLAEQLPYVRRILEAMRIPILEYTGFEADDVIGTIARRGEAAGLDVVIVSSDKDMMQLVTDRVTMLDPAKDDLMYDAAKVKEFLGVPPAQVADLFALKGDAIDNIPGAPGIGDKGARDLIERFGSVEAAMERAAEVERKMYRESLQNNVERIRMSKRLATIDTAVPIEFYARTMSRRSEPTWTPLKAVYKELEFHSLLRELGPSEDTRAARLPGARDAAAEVELSWRRFPLARRSPSRCRSARRKANCALGSYRTGLAAGRSARRCRSRWPSAASRFWKTPARPKIVCDVKSALLALWRLGIEARGFDARRHAVRLPAGCRSLRLPARRAGAAPPRHQARRRARTACRPHARTLEPSASGGGRARPAASSTTSIELPLTGVLARMERTRRSDRPRGTAAASPALMEGEIARLTAEIHALAGKPFNISSPQQLGKVLFEDLGLPAPVKYGKGKVISTAADVLEELAPDHEIVRKVLEYRQLTKLKGTYVDALPALSIRAPAGCTPASTRPARPPAGSRRRTRTCRTSPSRRNWAARSAPPSCRGRAGK